MKNVIFITEDLSEPFDEGIKNTAFNIIRSLKANFNLFVLSKYDSNNFTELPQLKIINTNRLFLNLELLKILSNFDPHIIIYLPSSSGTFASFLRMQTLHVFKKSARTVMITLQPKHMNKFERLIVKNIKPNMVLTPSQDAFNFFTSLSIESLLIPLFPTLEKFGPLESPGIKYELRKKYNLPIDKYIISHIGHLNYGRNLDELIKLQTSSNQVVIVGSSSTPNDAPSELVLIQNLKKQGIIILDGYINEIKEIYQLSDLYVFPVVSSIGSISFPLSILEARLCGLPVLTTKYGSIEYYLGDDLGCIFYSSPKNFEKKVDEIKSQNKSYTNTKVQELKEQFLNIFYSEIMN